MQAICLEEPAFYALVDQVISYIKTKHDVKKDKWISGEEAMKLLHIGKPTLQTYRNEGRLRYFQADRKIILYDRDSINNYLERNTKEPFS